MSTTLPSACPLDCPDSCSLNVDVADGRIVKVDGSKLNPYTDGFICGKVRRIADHVYGDDRVRTPLIRTGAKGHGEFRQASWDEALDRIASELAGAKQRSGGESILPFSYGGSNGFLTDGVYDARLFRRLGASRLVYTFCAAPSGAAHKGLYGRMPGVALGEYVHTKMITVWGTNPSATGIHFVPVIKEAKKRGAFLVIVDPREIPLAKQADLHIDLRPGTDLPVALGFINGLFERDAADHAFLAEHATGVDQLRARAAEWPLERVAKVADVKLAKLEQWLETYIATNPALIRCGWGLERNRNGGSAVAAVLALPAVAGKFGVHAGGFTMSNSGTWDGIDPTAAIGQAQTDTRQINMTQLGRALCELDDPKVEVLFVFNANPVATAPEQAKVETGMRRTDLFTVVHEQVMTDTARYADVVLPATTFLEHRELRGGYGAPVMFDAKPAIAPVGEARTNGAVFSELARRLDVAGAEADQTDDEVVEAIVSSTEHHDLWRTQLGATGMAASDNPTPIQFVDLFPRTADRKIHLFPAELETAAPNGLYGYQDDPATEAYPLALISPASAKTISSTFGQLIDGIVPIEISVSDAEARGINDGDKVRVFNAAGEVVTDAKVDADLRRGVLVLPKGLWKKHSHNGATSNALCPDTEADLGRGACYFDARVQIELA